VKQENITELNYEKILKDSLKAVLREVLKITEEQGLPGSHHFFITLDTTHLGVIIDKSLKLAYPEELTIVIQHQFWDLEVNEKFFEISLSFDGKKQHLHIPFEAVTAFTDPHANFGLQFKVKVDKKNVDETKVEDSEEKIIENNNKLKLEKNEEISSIIKNRDNEISNNSEEMLETEDKLVKSEKDSDKIVNLDNFRKKK